MAGDETSDLQRDDPGGLRSDGGGRASYPREGSVAPREFGEDLAMVVEIVRDFAALSSTEATLIRQLIGVVEDLSSASGALYESLTGLHARVDLLDAHGAATAATGRRGEIAEQLAGSRRALREQAHRLRRHADQLHHHAHRLCGRAESLTGRAFELTRESQHVLAAREQRRARVGGSPVGGDRSRA